MTDVTMSVNVSAHQLRDPGFLDTLVGALTRWDVPANSLVLEITETALLADDARVSADLAALRALGLRIAIDDFGTGYSSLDYLRRHAIDVLKIDRSFINGIETSGRQAALVGAIVHLAQALDVRVVAEGVETPGQRDALLRAGGGFGSGVPLFRSGIRQQDRPVATRPRTRRAPPATSKCRPHPVRNGGPAVHHRTAVAVLLIKP